MSDQNASKQTPPSNWQLPDGFENTLESGIIKAAVGATTGIVLGSLLFKSGKGWRSAGVAMGVGVAVGSTVERAYCSKQQ
mmetsp:Transcript_15959/g.20259  ORF Transcript_15959/g.20259 Transcript_15959/m.20259 type:complete len:80 (+) Transcript_15959:81-320(+)